MFKYINTIIKKKETEEKEKWINYKLESIIIMN